MAGFTTLPEHLFDNHVGPIPPPVWALLDRHVPLLKNAALLIEWDEHIPAFEELEEEARKVRLTVESYLERHQTSADRETTTHGESVAIMGSSSSSLNCEAQEVIRNFPGLDLESSTDQNQQGIYTNILISFLDQITAFPEHSPASVELLPAGRLTPKNSLQVYRDGYTYRLTEALCETFEAVGSVLGDEEFFALSQAYIEECPSGSYNLSDYGETFPDFLQQHPSCRTTLKDFPFLSDLARFEWVFKEVFHSPTPKVDPKTSATFTLNGTSVLRFPSSARILSSSTSIYSIWKTRKDRTSIPAWTDPQNLFIYKTSDQIRVTQLFPSEAGLLRSLFSGANLSEALESTMAGLDPNRVESIFFELREGGVRPLNCETE